MEPTSAETPCKAWAPIESCHLLTNVENMPIISGKVNGVSAKILVDTGASITLVSERFLNDLPGDKGFISEDPNLLVKGVSGKLLPITCCVELLFELSEQQFSHGVFVTSTDLSQQYDIILGFDALREQELIFDATTLALWKADLLHRLKNNVVCSTVWADNGPVSDNNSSLPEGKVVDMCVPEPDAQRLVDVSSGNCQQVEECCFDPESQVFFGGRNDSDVVGSMNNRITNRIPHGCGSYFDFGTQSAHEWFSFVKN